ncbi:MAG: hypothetical protein ABJA67_13890 [Chthonomonadales bacterium]
MIKLRGLESQGASVLGTVAIARGPHYVPAIPVDVERAIGRLRSDELLEKVDIILLTDKLSNVATLSLTWANIVAIVAEEAESPDVVRVPSISGVDRLLELATEGMIALIDGGRSVLYLEPGAEIVASYQSEADRLRPSSRYHLGFNHAPAVTLDGKQIRVLATAESLKEVESAITNGADGVLTSYRMIGEHEQRFNRISVAERLVEHSAGKTIEMVATTDSVTIPEFIEITTKVDVVLCFTGTDSSQAIDRFQSECHHVAGLMKADEQKVGLWRLAQTIGLFADLEEPYFAESATRIHLSLPHDTLSLNEETTCWMSNVILEAHNQALAVEVILESAGARLIEDVLHCNADALIVPIPEVQHAKSVVRAISNHESIFNDETG